MLERTVVEAAEHFGAATALRTADGERLSFGDLEVRSGALAGRLIDDYGIGAGAVVGLCCTSAIDYVTTYAALARLGAVTAGISPVLSAAERQGCVDSLGAATILGDPALDPSGSMGIVAVDTHASGPAPDPLPEDGERMVCVVFTSGTTGPPKAAVFRDRHLRAVCETDLGPGWEQRWGGGGPMIISTQLPHVGFMTKLPWYLRMGGTLHALARWRADDVLRLVADEGIEVLGVVAPQLALMLRSPLLDELDVSSVSHIVAGGAASPPELVREARRRFGATYSIRYSSTESGGVGTATAADAPDEEALHTIGRPRPGVEVRIVDADGVDAPQGAVGELWVRSGAVADGYLDAPEATAATFTDGWLHTGDLASFDQAGGIRLEGRQDDRFIRGGYNVAPGEVEAVLADHPAIMDVAVVPRSDEVMGSRCVAVLVVRDRHVCPTTDDLQRHCAGRLASWKRPEDVITVEALPLTPMHKVDRRRLTAMVNVGGSGDG